MRTPDPVLVAFDDDRHGNGGGAGLCHATTITRPPREARARCGQATPCDYAVCGPKITVAFIYESDTNTAFPITVMGAFMSKPEDVDEVIGVSLAEMEAAAADLYEHR